MIINKPYSSNTIMAVSYSSYSFMKSLASKVLLTNILILIALSQVQADETQTVSYTYNTQGLVETINGSRTDVNDITTYDYDTQGNRTKITNALGHITQITQFDASGRPLRLVDANQVVTLLTYHPRGWLATINVSGKLTTLTYDGVGQLIKQTRPNGGFTSYTYDEAHRLTDITDHLGNTIHYTLDLVGNHLKEETKDSAGILTRVLEQEYDKFSQLLLSISGVNNDTQRYQYDNNSNLIAQTDARQTPTDSTAAKTVDPLTLDNTSTSNYDALNRLIAQIHQQTATDTTDNISSTYQYNDLDQLTTVTDPNGGQTHYTYNIHGDLLQTDSPDTGITNYSYDETSNRKSMADARGITVNYQYDALNRLTFINYTDNIHDVTYTYDSCSNGIGKLCQIQDQSGVTQYSYDSWGNRLTESHLYQGNTYTTTYEYDSDNQISSIEYPTGHYINYIRNTLGQTVEIAHELQGIESSLSEQEYKADGQLSIQTLGNGLFNEYIYNLQGQLTDLYLANGDQTLWEKYYTYDANGNLLDDFQADLIREYEYDGINRLFFETKFENDILSLGIAHELDVNGNLFYQGIEGTNPEGYSSMYLAYNPNSNQLSDINSSPVQLDAIGNTLNNGQGKTYDYYPTGRLWKSYNAGIHKATYRYNSLGQRIEKIEHQTGGDQTTLYFYDQSGHLIAEYQNDQPKRGYVWLNDRPVAQVELGNNATGATIEKITYFSTDYLTTPRIGTDEQKNIIWRWESDAYGREVPQVFADYLGQSRDINLRFPGQYFDQETGLHYNYYRYYDPSTGRYITSDPIGLSGGINTYVYVGGNPLYYSDPFGLAYRSNLAIFGHGNVVNNNGANVGGYIVDTPTSNPNRGLPVFFGQPIPSGADVDFFYANGQWHKVKNGTVIVEPDPKDPCKVIVVDCLPSLWGFPCEYFPWDSPPPHSPWNTKPKIDAAKDYLNRSQNTGLPGLPVK